MLGENLKVPLLAVAVLVAAVLSMTGHTVYYVCRGSEWPPRTPASNREQLPDNRVVLQVHNSNGKRVAVTTLACWKAHRKQFVQEWGLDGQKANH